MALNVKNTIRDGENNSDWTDYTGPITVRMEDVGNVYINSSGGERNDMIPTSDGGWLYTTDSGYLSSIQYVSIYKALYVYSYPDLSPPIPPMFPLW